MRLKTWILAAFLLVPPALLAAGPAYLVKDLKTGVDPFDPSFLHASFYGYAAAGGRVVFFGQLPEGSVFSAQPQCGLWSTDGTAAGTFRLADLCERLDELDEFQIRRLASNGAVAFVSDAGGRIWRTDGTAAGTFPLGAVHADPFGATSTAIGPGGVLFFSGCTPLRGCEPWRSDGTVQGTRLLRDVRPGPLSSSPSAFLADGGRVLFTAAGGLWSTDGTPAGTVGLAQVAPATTRMENQLIRRGNLVYFIANPGPDDVWSYDLATRKAVKLGSFATDYRHGSGARIELAAGRVLIRQYDSDAGRAALWSTDGTRAGTRALAPEFQQLGPVREAGGKVVFAAVRPSPTGLGPGRLWTLAQGANRPILLKGCPGGCPEVFPSWPPRSLSADGSTSWAMTPSTATSSGPRTAPAPAPAW